MKTHQSCIRFFLAIVTFSIAILMIGCADKPTQTDSKSPDKVTSLVAGTPTACSITLTWTAPSIDGGNGTATTYDVRYATSSITEANWSSALRPRGNRHLMRLETPNRSRSRTLAEYALLLCA